MYQLPKESTVILHGLLNSPSLLSLLPKESTKHPLVSNTKIRFPHCVTNARLLLIAMEVGSLSFDPSELNVEMY